RPGGLLALSGSLHGQRDELLARYGAWFDDLAVTRQGDWVRIDGVRRHAAPAPDDPIR
ncbi:MAG: 50S ribosomal protein L11 methyltransferase, partial [Proteobacteria bacterium]|nr:50S ribosomal protein L11 methyltransferase [Pseudomonadota bacterium]